MQIYADENQVLYNRKKMYYRQSGLKGQGEKKNGDIGRTQGEAGWDR